MRVLHRLRLALATRLGVEDGDEDYWHSLPDDDPRAQAHDIYEWVGWLQETDRRGRSTRREPDPRLRRRDPHA